MAVPGLFFPSFQTNITIFTTNNCEIVHPVYGAGIQTHDRQDEPPPITIRPGHLPDQKKFCYLGKLLKLFGNLLRLYFALGKSLTYFGKYFAKSSNLLEGVECGTDDRAIVHNTRGRKFKS